MSYIGHGLSHAIFGGFAASALIGVNFILGAGVWGVASALMIGGVTRRKLIGADAAIGVITTASFALGSGAVRRVRPARPQLRRRTVRQHPRRRPRRRGGDLARRGRRRRASCSSDTARSCSPRSTPTSPRRRACAPPGSKPLLMVMLAATDPRHDADPRRHADRRDARDPADDRPDADQLLQPDAVAVDRDRGAPRASSG